MTKEQTKHLKEAKLALDQAREVLEAKAEGGNFDPKVTTVGALLIAFEELLEEQTETSRALSKIEKAVKVLDERVAGSDPNTPNATHV